MGLFLRISSLKERLGKQLLLGVRELDLGKGRGWVGLQGGSGLRWPYRER